VKWLECEYWKVIWKEFSKDDLPFWRSDVATKEVHGSSWRSLRDTHLILMMKTLCGCAVLLDAEYKITALKRS
jgi:hypothetical protein